MEVEVEVGVHSEGDRIKYLVSLPLACQATLGNRATILILLQQPIVCGSPARQSAQISPIRRAAAYI